MTNINATAATGTTTATAIFPPADSPPALGVELMDAVEVAVGVADDDEDDLVEEEVCGGLELVVTVATIRTVEGPA